MKKPLLLLSLMVFTIIGYTQDSLQINFGGSLMSRYILNGKDVGGNTPAIQPHAAISIKGFTFGIWGSFATNNVNANEMDWYVSYKIKNIVSIQFMDVFFPNDEVSSNKYFNYDEDNATKHNLRASFDIHATKNFPFSFHAQTYFYSSIDKDKNGDKRYSSYFEVNYRTSYKDISIQPFLGITPAEGFWGDDFGVVNTGAELKKNIKITESYKLPISAKLIVNPQSENIYFVFGLHF